MKKIYYISIAEKGTQKHIYRWVYFNVYAKNLREAKSLVWKRLCNKIKAYKDWRYSEFDWRISIINLKGKSRVLSSNLG